MTGPNIIHFFNGMFSFLKYGLENVYDGFGDSRHFDLKKDDHMVGDGSHSYGNTSFIPTGDAFQVIDQLATILTSGRLSTENRAIIEAAFTGTIEAGMSFKEAFINAEQLIATTPEFHSTGLVRKTGADRNVPPAPMTSVDDYKAVVYVLLDGGMDSYNMLVPHSCTGPLRNQYDSERGSLAFNATERDLLIDASGSGQPCQTFALHDELILLKELYDMNELIFFANTGVINRNNMTKFNYDSKTETQLFAHNTMSDEAQKVDPFDQAPGTGVLGRAADVLDANGFIVNKISIDSPSKTVVGKPNNSPMIVSRNGAKRFNRKPGREDYFNLTDYTSELNAETDPQSSIFGETWSDEFLRGIEDANKLHGYFSSATLSNVWDGQTLDEFAQQFNTISKLIQTHDLRGTDRDIFYVNLDDWDHHRDMKDRIRERFQTLNRGLSLFADELEAQGTWDNVTIVITSDFARTITSNSNSGSDHAWGGHYWMMGKCS